MTRLAPIRLIPSPPAFVDIRNNLNLQNMKNKYLYLKFLNV